jgi:hypothetical protein
VDVDLDMLSTQVLNGVGREVDGADVVAVDESALWQWSMELLEELPEPTSFSHAICHGAILSLGAQSGDDVLPLGGSGDEVVIEEHNIAWGGSMCIRTTRLVNIRVDCQLRGGEGASQVEAEVQEDSQIAHDTLHNGDVGVDERQVLEGTSEASELSRISNRKFRSGGNIGLRVHRRRDRLAFHHASALKDIESELALSEEESICLILYGDPPKMVKRAEVLRN